MDTYMEIGNGKTGANEKGRPYKLIRSKGRPAIIYDKKIWVLEGDLTDAELKEKAPQFIKLIQREKARERKRKLKLKAKTDTTPPMSAQIAKTNPFQNIIQSAAATPYGPSFVSKTLSDIDIKAQIETIRKEAEKEKTTIKREIDIAKEELAKLKANVSREKADIMKAAEDALNKVREEYNKNLDNIEDDIEAVIKLKTDAEAETEAIKAETDAKIAELETRERELRDRMAAERITALTNSTNAEIEALKNKNEELENTFERLSKDLMEATEAVIVELKEEFEADKQKIKDDYEAEKVTEEEYNRKINLLKLEFEREKTDIINESNKEIDALTKRLKDESVKEVVDIQALIEKVNEKIIKTLTESGPQFTDKGPAWRMGLRIPNRWKENIMIDDDGTTIAYAGSNIIINNENPKAASSVNSRYRPSNLKDLFYDFYRPVDAENVVNYAKELKIPLPYKIGGTSGRLGPDSLSNLQIDEYAQMADIEEYLPAVSIYDLPELDGETAAFIANTNLHWVAIRVNEDDSVEYYDPLGEEPPDEFFEWLQDESINGQIKINQVKNQSDESSTCGFHALKFLIDRQNGKTWKEATNFNRIEKYMDMSDDAEKKIRPLIKNFRAGNI
jgi:hypothetical protein